MLVDLAGSERLNSTGSSAGAAIKETGAINKSLFVLGQVCALHKMRLEGALAANSRYQGRHTLSPAPRMMLLVLLRMQQWTAAMVFMCRYWLLPGQLG